MLTQALDPKQTSSGITSVSNPSVLDTMTLTRTG
jgi:hypothetical protein